MNLGLSVEEAVVEAADRVEVADPGAKADDRPGERDARRRAMAELRAALTVEVDVRAAAAEAVAGRAEAAVWLGASLADLGGVTGRSRQAARQRWSGLGGVHRQRRWLGNHVDEVLWAARLVLDAADDLEGVDPAVRTALADAVAAAERAFGDDAPDGVAAAVGRWRALDTLVDRHLRDLLAGVPAEPADPTAAFAAHGARGVLAYYDHDVHQRDPDQPG
ncbi:hypothetical protein ACQPX6_25595 [Actinomycetospora sp. CA-101289]|uniref:hypothetical protein n=1 Tax=Actinomycetospora sp. CA-101289 TaxID=3239893 RepID=UPI003D95910C